MDADILLNILLFLVSFMVYNKCSQDCFSLVLLASETHVKSYEN